MVLLRRLGKYVYRPRRWKVKKEFLAAQSVELEEIMRNESFKTWYPDNRRWMTEDEAEEEEDSSGESNFLPYLFSCIIVFSSSLIYFLS